jgi:tetratricopeptide (TPR) repeat protein
MELAHKEDPDDGQICFWLGRDLMWANRHDEAIPLLERYLALPSITWADERSEAMRYLARMQAEKRMLWLDKARMEAPHRREIWHDLAEELHGKSDWLNLFWACSNGIEKTHRTGSYLDDSHCWGFRLFDLGAIAAWHLNAMDRAVDWGQKALALDPNNQRLKNNLDFFIHRQEEGRGAAKVSEPFQTVAAGDEQSWHSVLGHARSLREAGNESEFVKAALQAFRVQPHRAEALHDLARYYLATARGEIAIVYAGAGMSLPCPEEERVGLEQEVYRTGLKEAFTIAASYSKDPAEKERGRAVCNWLSLTRDAPTGVRGLARHNYNWYAEPARSLMPSIRFQPVSIDAPTGFKPGNISITRTHDGFVALIRAVNYDLLDSGYFDRHGDTSFRQRTIMLQLDSDLKIVSSTEILQPEDMPLPQHTDSLGFEDPRPLVWRGDLWCISSVRQLNPEGRAEMVLARIGRTLQGSKVLTDWRVLPSGMPVQWEKNWMPQVIGDELRFIYSLDPTRILSDTGETLFQEAPAIAVENFRGGTQAIPFDGGWLALIHEWQVPRRRRHYFHRLVWFDENNRLRRMSRRFFFQRIASEFAAGLAWHMDNNRLIVSFGTDDHDPAFAVVQVDEVRQALLNLDEHEKACQSACAAGRATWETLSTSDQFSIDSCPRWMEAGN